MRLAIHPHDVAQSVQQHPLRLQRVAGLPHRQTRQFHTNRGGNRRLVCPALTRQRDARRRAREHEACARVDRVDQRVQATTDKRVVDGADRQQLRTVKLGTKTELPEQEKEIHLRDAELDVLALRRRLPLEWAGILDLVDRFDLGTKDAALIDPATEARRN